MYALQAHRAFSPLDEVLPAFYYCYCICFRSTIAKDAAIDLLQRSAWSIAVERPYLTATVRRILDSDVRKGHLVLDLPESLESLPIVFKDLTDTSTGWKDTYDALSDAGMPPGRLDAHIIAPLTAGTKETRKVVSIQANLIPGGLILAFCFHHNFVDAHGAGRIISRFSEHCAKLKNESGSTNGYINRPIVPDVIKPFDVVGSEGVPECLNIHKLKQKYQWADIEARENLWKLNCLEFRAVNDFRWPEFIPSLLPARDPPVVSSLLSMSPDSLAEIKRQAQPIANSGWVSTNDALVAFLWRHTMRARFPEPIAEGSSEKKDSFVIIALNGRKDLGIPPSYIGNVIFHCYTQLPINFITNRETPLGEIAASIRKTVTEMRDPALMQDVIGLAATHPDIQTIKYANDNLGSDLYTTSWADLPVYDLQWGPLGRAEFFRIPERQFESLCCILPRRNGVLEIITSMQKHHSERLLEDAEFRKLVNITS